MAAAGHSARQREKAEDVRLMVDTIAGLVWSPRSDGSAEFFNRRWLEYTGLSAEQALEWGWKVAIHPDDLPRILEIFHEALSLGRSFEVEGRFRRWDGQFRWFLFRGNPLLDGMLLNHTGCGFTTFTDDGMNAKLAALTGDASPAPMRFFSYKDPEQNTREQIKKVRSHPWIAKEVPVRGFIFDVETGLIREVRQVAQHTAA
ncbi:MAG TPA: PAS domain-containing protein [Candidatus Acidoferrales bacterium]|jgi:PAS domain S-box-containing protein|nr:PAS domain-containing protein [Candidatus Acidoferrales bacterium]